MLRPIFVLCLTVRLFLAAREENEIQIGSGPQLRYYKVSVFSTTVIFINSLDGKIPQHSDTGLTLCSLAGQKKAMTS